VQILRRKSRRTRAASAVPRPEIRPRPKRGFYIRPVVGRAIDTHPKRKLIPILRWWRGNERKQSVLQILMLLHERLGWQRRTRVIHQHFNVDATWVFRVPPYPELLLAQCPVVGENSPPRRPPPEPQMAPHRCAPHWCVLVQRPTSTPAPNTGVMVRNEYSFSHPLFRGAGITTGKSAIDRIENTPFNN